MAPHPHGPLPATDIDSHFDRALELEPRARATWLAELSVTHPDIAREVRARLIKLDALDANGFLLGSPYEMMDATELRKALSQKAVYETGDLRGAGPAAAAQKLSGLVAGAAIGPYRLIREIGHGGMSSVWLAERSDGQLKREVALKLPTMGLRMQVERFLRERDILAALTHPNIARLYDAGISESQQPYLAMEYVAGNALIGSCNTRRLSVTERLQLFGQVLEAVQFAHAKLIIHRDLKPSNILVMDAGRVVLLDFGIGKLLTADTVRDTPLTQLSGRALTPDYASPEQITGEALGTASDIYSLGVILYELLTGSRPYRLRRQSRAILEEAILSEDVRKPSQCEISAEQAAERGTSVRGLARSLRGDLDTIVLKALKKEPLDRYASVTALAQDISNHLQRLPVSARPDSSWYQIGRFILRHKASVAAAGIAAISILAGATVAIWQARAAATERDRAVAFAIRNAAVSEFLGRVITQAAESARPVTVSEMLARSEQLALSNTTDSPENRAAILEMIADRYTSLDDMKRSRQLLTSARALLQSSQDSALQSRLTCKQVRVSISQPNTAIRAINQELTRVTDPETAAQCLLEVARVYADEHRAADTLRSAQRGLEQIRKAARPSTDMEATLTGVLARAYFLSGRTREADRYFAAALQKFKELGQERSDGMRTLLNDWAVALRSAGVPGRALQLLEEEGRIETERESGAQPTATNLGNQARMLESLGRYELARARFEQECQVSIRNDDALTQVHCLLGLTSVALDTESWDQAQTHLNRAGQFLGGDVPPQSPPMRAREVLQGRIDLAAGRLTEAAARFDQVLAHRDATIITFQADLGRAETALAQKDAARAIESARRALQWATSVQGNLPHSDQTGLASLMVGRALQEAGDAAGAHAALTAAVLHLSNTVDADHPALVRARQLLAIP